VPGLGRRLRNMRDKLRADKSKATEFSQGLLVNGICATPHPLFLSTALTQQGVDRTLEAAETALREMKESR